MKKEEFMALTKDSAPGLLVTLVLGVAAWKLKAYTAANKMAIANFLDPLLVAMVVGIIIRAIVGVRRSLISGFILAPIVFMPLGVVLYGVVNLDFKKFGTTEPKHIVLMLLVIAAYYAVVLWIGKMMKAKEKITYLTATGSAICGASAISVTAPTVEAEPDEVSISLLSVFIIGLITLVTLPAIAQLTGYDKQTEALFAGMILQFTGFVKAYSGLGAFSALAQTIKATRYLGLLIAIPLFSSLIRKKFYTPWFLWAFLIAGLLGTYLKVGDVTFAKYLDSYKIKDVLDIMWSIAMGAIGLNTNIRAIFSIDGIKALSMSLFGAIAAVITFLLGIKIIA